MTIKDVLPNWQTLRGIISNREPIIKALEKEKIKMERSTKKVEYEDLLHYSMLVNAIQYFEEMTDDECFEIKRRIQSKPA